MIYLSLPETNREQQKANITNQMFALCLLSKLFMFVLSCCYMCLFDCKCKSLNRLGERINKQIRKTHQQNQQTKSFEKNTTKTTDIQDIQPSTRPRINISQVPAGKWCISVCSVFMFFFCFSRSCLCCLSVCICVFDCKCKSLNRLGENRTQQTDINKSNNRNTSRK